MVSDLDMPGVDGLTLLKAIRERHPDLPFILFTGKGSEEVASDAIAAGVTDYLQKSGGSDQFAILANRIENAVSGYRARREHERAERRFRKLIEESVDVVAVFGPEGTFRYVSPAAESVVGYEPEALVGEDVFDHVHPDDRERVFESRYTTAADGTGLGLAIVRRIAEAHGWSVQVREGQDGGARLEVSSVESAVRDQ